MTSRSLSQTISEQIRTRSTDVPTFLTYTMDPPRDTKKTPLRKNPVEATMTVERKSKATARVMINSFSSPLLGQEFGTRKTHQKADLADFRNMIDAVFIDPDYQRTVFHTSLADVPMKKDQVIKGVYEIQVPRSQCEVAVKIIAVTGEEILLTHSV